MCWKGRGYLDDQNKYDVSGDWCVGKGNSIQLLKTSMMCLVIDVLKGEKGKQHLADKNRYDAFGDRCVGKGEAIQLITISKMCLVIDVLEKERGNLADKNK